MASLMSAYGRLPVTMTRGDGARVWDDTGREYLDGLSGIAVTALGHATPAISQAIADQAQKLMHVSNLYHIPEQEAQRGLHQDSPAARPCPQNRYADHYCYRHSLSWPHHGNHRGHWQREDQGRVWTDAARLSRCPLR